MLILLVMLVLLVCAGDAGFVTGRLRADAFDLLDSSGMCDPLEAIDPDIARVLNDPTALFPKASGDLRAFPGIPQTDQLEYVRLVGSQLASGKVELRREISGGGVVLARSKKDSDKLREVWHGAAVSESSAEPPAPPHLSPSSFS